MHAFKITSSLTTRLRIRKGVVYFLMNFRLKRAEVAVDLDSMEEDQIIAVYKVLEKSNSLKGVALWSCFFNFRGKRQSHQRADYNLSQM